MPKRFNLREEAQKAFQNRKRKPELKRDAVLSTAAHLFLKQGYRRTSMEDIADHLEITKPALYHYFTSKDDILVGCYSQGIASILTRLDDADKATGSGLEKTRAFLRVWVETITTMEFGQCVVSLDDNELAPAARSEVRRLKRRIDRSLRKRIAEGVADGTMKPCDIRLVAFAFGGAVNSIGAWYDPNGKLSTSAFVKAYTDILIDGVSMAPAPKPVRSSRSGNASKT
ncbi:MAG TPA: TetR/AcrR family transcriptional regulator [Alloacidobacterium sp.]|nr:TetR/AcrR family transcriptional regulator [Alloacidobacterium sp.]